MKISKLIRLVRVVRNWPRTLMDHLQFATTDYVCHLRNGTSIEVRGGTDDRHVIFEVFIEHVYPIHISPGDIVIDIGAHIGCFTVLAAKAGARVFSFEACHANYVMLERNVRLNKLANVQIFNTAIAGKREKRQLFLSDDPAHSGRHSLILTRGARTQEVSTISLDDVLIKNNLRSIDLLKIDSEASEYEILYKASAQTLARTRAMMVECHRVTGKPQDWSMAGMQKYLERLGFNTRTQARIVHAERRLLNVSGRS